MPAPSHSAVIALKLTMLGILAFLPCRLATAADPAPPAAGAPASDERLQEIIEQVEANEALYQRLETVVHFTQRSSVAAEKGPSILSQNARWHTILQGDLLWFRSKDVVALPSGKQMPGGSLSAFDGQRSRSVEYGNCVNIRQGRYEPWQIMPPHNWAMHQFQINFPLSVFLRGVKAIDNHPKPRHFTQHGGSLYDFAKLEFDAEAEETIGGLQCVSLRCRRWYQPLGEPTVQYIWLAKQRNYLCVRSQTVSRDGATIGDEGRVTEWRELKPGMWLPARVSIEVYAPPGRQGDRPATVQRAEELEVERADPIPNYPRSHFRDVEMPGDLPIYRIDADGYLEDSPLKTSLEPRPQAELDRLIAAVRAEEERYSRYDVSVKTKYRKIHAQETFAGVTMSQDINERSVAFDGRLFSLSQNSYSSANGSVSDTEHVRVFDGGWNRERTIWSYDGPPSESSDFVDAPGSASPTGNRRIQQDYALIGRGGPDAIVMFRPHTALFDDDRLRMHRLSSLLESPMYDEVNHYRMKVEYLGSQTVDDHVCEKLRITYDAGAARPQFQGFYLWLANDRNYLPVRQQSYDLARHGKLPTSVAYVDELREVAPGLWFPYHAVHRAHVSAAVTEGVCEGRILINWVYDHRVQKLDFNPDSPNNLFQLPLPEGIKVGVFVGKHRSLGQCRQLAEGPASISEAKWQAMLLADQPNETERQNRRFATAAMLDRPVPEMPQLEWLQGGPITWRMLKGKVVLLFFWAEWGYPEGSLRALIREAETLADAGIMLVGIHPRGSMADEIRLATDELKLNCPIAVDAPGGKEPSWGKFYEDFRLRDVSHAFVIDRTGKIAAEGWIDRMVPKAIAIARQK